MSTSPTRRRVTCSRRAASLTEDPRQQQHQQQRLLLWSALAGKRTLVVDLALVTKYLRAKYRWALRPQQPRLECEHRAAVMYLGGTGPCDTSSGLVVASVLCESNYGASRLANYQEPQIALDGSQITRPSRRASNLSGYSLDRDHDKLLLDHKDSSNNNDQPEEDGCDDGDDDDDEEESHHAAPTSPSLSPVSPSAAADEERDPIAPGQSHPQPQPQHQPERRWHHQHDNGSSATRKNSSKDCSSRRGHRSQSVGGPAEGSSGPHSGGGGGSSGGNAGDHGGGGQENQHSPGQAAPGSSSDPPLPSSDGSSGMSPAGVSPSAIVLSARGSTAVTGNDRSGGGGRGGRGSSQQQGARPCYFCWCCCCSCSCLNVKSQMEEPLRSQISNEPQSRLEVISSEDKVTLEEAQKWAQNFDFLMQSKGGSKVFHEFLKLEYSEENIMFYRAVEELQQESSPDLIEEKARAIYEDYISILSPKEVSLDSRVREIINSEMAQPCKRVFDEAQVQIFTLMQRDSYPRFINSRLYKDFLHKLGDGSGTTTGSGSAHNDSAAAAGTMGESPFVFGGCGGGSSGAAGSISSSHSSSHSFPPQPLSTSSNHQM